KDAEQIPIYKYIDRCFSLENGTDINKFSGSKGFITLLREKIYGSDKAQIDNIINCLSKLDISKLPDDNKSAILPLWNWLARTKIKTSVSEQAFGNNYKLLVSNVENEYKLKIVEHLCKQIQSFEEF